MIFAMMIGYVVGAVLAFYLSRRLLGTMAARAFKEAEQRKWVWVVGGIFGAISLAPAIFLAMMFGGLLGGGYDHAVSSAIGLGDSGDGLILAVRLMIVISLFVTINAAVGGAIGLLMARALRRDPSIAD